MTITATGPVSYRFASWAWNRLRTSLRERFGAFAYFRAVEAQARGAAHYHLIVSTPRTFWPMEDVRALAVSAGFGPQMELQAVRGVERAASYATKYATKEAGDVSGVPTGWRFYAASAQWRANARGDPLVVAVPRDDGVTWSYVRQQDVSGVIAELHAFVGLAPP